MPTLSEAEAETGILPDTVESFAGAVIETVGGVMSLTAFDTVTVIEAEALLPVASKALAVKVWELFDSSTVFKLKLYGLEVSVALSSEST